jgi:3-oxoacyl-[acyl-carrier protein] reductase
LKRVLVTGGSRGLGLEVCRALAADGYSVVTISRSNSPELDKAVTEFPGRIRSVLADLSDLRHLKKICREIQSDDGFDGFVANAAIGTEGLLTLTSPEKIEHSIQLNLTSVVLLTRELIKEMLSRGGSLVFISSITAIRGFSGLSVYAATKGALLSFSRTLAREYGPRNVRSNCVLPGFFRSEMTRTISSEDKARIERRTPLQRVGEATDIVGTTKFLLSDQSRFITGAEFVIDGGLTA